MICSKKKLFEILILICLRIDLLSPPMADDSVEKKILRKANNRRERQKINSSSIRLRQEKFLFHYNVK